MPTAAAKAAKARYNAAMRAQARFRRRHEDLCAVYLRCLSAAQNAPALYLSAVHAYIRLQWPVPMNDWLPDRPVAQTAEQRWLAMVAASEEPAQLLSASDVTSRDGEAAVSERLQPVPMQPAPSPAETSNGAPLMSTLTLDLAKGSRRRAAAPKVICSCRSPGVCCKSLGLPLPPLVEPTHLLRGRNAALYQPALDLGLKSWKLRPGHIDRRLFNDALALLDGSAGLDEQWVWSHGQHGSLVRLHETLHPAPERIHYGICHECRDDEGSEASPARDPGGAWCGGNSHGPPLAPTDAAAATATAADADDSRATAAAMLAVAMGTHPRLGAASPLRALPQDLLRRIDEMARVRRALLVSYPQRPGHRPDRWGARHMPPAIYDLVYEAWLKVRWVLPEACHHEPPNCVVATSYMTGQSDTSVEGDETIHWHNDRYAFGNPRVSQRRGTAVLSISMGATMLLKVRKHKNKRALPDECGTPHVAAALDSGSVLAWLDEDDMGSKHSPKFAPRHPWECSCGCHKKIDAPSAPGQHRWSLVGRWLDTLRRHALDEALYHYAVSPGAVTFWLDPPSTDA